MPLGETQCSTVVIFQEPRCVGAVIDEPPKPITHLSFINVVTQFVK
ncbi:hypothetical protein IWX64_003370 [Arthrobacter sp. CAN_A212]